MRMKTGCDPSGTACFIAFINMYAKIYKKIVLIFTNHLIFLDGVIICRINMQGMQLRRKNYEKAGFWMYRGFYGTWHDGRLYGNGSR